MSGGARIPADIERPDRVLAGLTARQLGILASAGVGAWLAGSLARTVLPPVGAVAVAWPVLLVGLGLALGRRDGLSLDRLALAAWRQRRAPRRMVPAPEGVPPAPAFAGCEVGGLPAPMELPVRGLDGDGVFGLGPDGSAVVCRASGTTFSLRTQAEQDALVAAFARFLNGASGPVQFLVRAIPIDLAGMVGALERAAGGLPHPALEAAAREHARFLGSLAGRGDVLHREILLVLREPAGGPAGAEVLGRRAEQAASLLAAAGVTLRRLDGAQAAAALAGAADPGRHLAPAGGLATPGQVITGRGAGGA